MHIVALGSQKGGVGKSSTAIHLAAAAVEAGAKAAIVDMDEGQATSLKWGKRRNGAGLLGPEVYPGTAANLKATLDKLKADGYEWVFLDLPGRNAADSGAGLTASELILLPTRPLDVDIEASVATVQAAKRAGKRYSYLLNIVLPQYEKTRAVQVAGTLEALGHKVSPVQIIQRTIVAEAISSGDSAIERKPKSESAEEFRRLFQWLKGELE